MYCQYCGTELSPNARFCSNCGKPVGGTQPEQEAPTKSKVFHFGALTYNKGAMEQINSWLTSQKIIIKRIYIQVQLNDKLPLKYEVVPLRVEFEYVENPKAPVFQMDYFKQMKIFGTSTERLERSLGAWKTDNPQRRVVFHQTRSYQVDDGSVATLFFLYY